MDIWRIVWNPKNPRIKIHGIRFRETIQDAADKSTPPICGEVRNLPDNRVELFCAVEESNLLFFLAAIKSVVKKIAKVDVEYEKPALANDLKQWKKFPKMEVIRDDTLREIDLAIRGAEHMFRNLQKDIVHFVEQREQTKLKGLYFEFNKLREIVRTKDTGRLATIHRAAMDGFFAQPFDADLLNICQEIDVYLYDISPEKTKKEKDWAELDELLTRAINHVENLQQSEEAKKNINSKEET